MQLESNLAEMERAREAYWLRYGATSPLKLRWRALTVRHAFHILPGEKILELGAGSGLWTQHLSEVTRGECPITAVVFNDEYLNNHRSIPNAEFVKVSDLEGELPAGSFDYVVGTAILCHNLYPQNLRALYRLLKPGGQLLFFEANYWNPQVALKNTLRRFSGHASCQIGLRKYKLLQMASHQGFVKIDVIAYDIVHPRTPRFLISYLQSLAFILEHAPLIKEACGTLYIWAKKPGDEEQRRPSVSLAQYPQFFGAISFVVPCHNEEMNIPLLVDTLVKYYDAYIHEIVIVNDNSRDGTAAVTRQIARREPRVKLIDREPPNGVGRALRDGYAAATGAYILTMDSDFVQIVPEFRDLFDAVAAGYDGAIGSRFSHDSLLINYPFFKIFCNRSFHILVNALLPVRVRDISNNLKLYRAEVLKELDLEQPHFAANAETGLKPLLAGYKVKEVAISWINRTIEMGSSSFRIAAVAPNYVGVLIHLLWRTRRQARRQSRGRAASASSPEI